MVLDERRTYRTKELPSKQKEDVSGVPFIPSQILADFLDLVVGHRGTRQHLEIFEKECQELLENGYKFRCILVYLVIEELLEANAFTDKSLENIRTAFSSLLPFALNLHRYPEQKEYRVIKQYTAYFTLNIADKLHPCNHLAGHFLHAMGYLDDDANDQFVLSRVSRSITEVTFELYLSRFELDRLISTVNSATKANRFSANDVVSWWVNYFHSNGKKWQPLDFIRNLPIRILDSRTVGGQDEAEKTREKTKRLNVMTPTDSIELKTSKLCPKLREALRQKPQPSTERTAVGDDWMYDHPTSLPTLTGPQSTEPPSVERPASQKFEATDRPYENCAPVVGRPVTEDRRVADYGDSALSKRGPDSLLSRQRAEASYEIVSKDNQRPVLKKEDSRGILYPPPSESPIGNKPFPDWPSREDQGNPNRNPLPSEDFKYDAEGRHYSDKQQSGHHKQQSIATNILDDEGRVPNLYSVNVSIVPKLYSVDVDSGDEEIKVPKLYSDDVDTREGKKKLSNVYSAV